MAKKQDTIEQVATEVSEAEVAATMAEDAVEAVVEEAASRKGRGQGALKRADDGRLVGNHLGQTGIRLWLQDEVAKYFQPPKPDPVAMLAGVDSTDLAAWREANRQIRDAFKACEKTCGPMVADFLSAILTGTTPQVDGVEGLVNKVRERLTQ